MGHATLRKRYWMLKNGFSWWGVSCEGSKEITKEVHEMKPQFKKCLFFATKYKISK